MTQDKMIIDRYRNDEGGYDDVVRPHNDFFRASNSVGESVGMFITVTDKEITFLRMAHLLRVIYENHKERQADGDPTNLNDTIDNQIEKVLEEYDEMHGNI